MKWAFSLKRCSSIFFRKGYQSSCFFVYSILLWDIWVFWIFLDISFDILVCSTQNNDILGNIYEIQVMGKILFLKSFRVVDKGQWFSTRDDFDPPGDIWQCLDISDRHDSGVGPETSWVDTRDTAKYSTMHKTALHNKESSLNHRLKITVMLRLKKSALYQNEKISTTCIKRM